MRKRGLSRGGARRAAVVSCTPKVHSEDGVSGQTKSRWLHVIVTARGQPRLVLSFRCGGCSRLRQRGSLAHDVVVCVRAWRRRPSQQRREHVVARNAALRLCLRRCAFARRDDHRPCGGRVPGLQHAAGLASNALLGIRFCKVRVSRRKNACSSGSCASQKTKKYCACCASHCECAPPPHPACAAAPGCCSATSGPTESTWAAVCIPREDFLIPKGVDAQR